MPPPPRGTVPYLCKSRWPLFGDPAVPRGDATVPRGDGALPPEGASKKVEGRQRPLLHPDGKAGGAPAPLDRPPSGALRPRRPLDRPRGPLGGARAKVFRPREKLVRPTRPPEQTASRLREGLASHIQGVRSRRKSPFGMSHESPGTPDGSILFSRAATTGPSSGYEVFGPGRQDVFTEPESCPQEPR
jgi:hypothetical protein